MPKRAILHVMVSSAPPAPVASQVEISMNISTEPYHDLPSDVDPTICPFISLTDLHILIYYLLP